MGALPLPTSFSVGRTLRPFFCLTSEEGSSVPFGAARPTAGGRLVCVQMVCSVSLVLQMKRSPGFVFTDLVRRVDCLPWHVRLGHGGGPAGCGAIQIRVCCC